MMKNRDLCLIGAGRMAMVHARSVASLTQARIAAVVDPSKEAGEALATMVGGEWYESFDVACSKHAFDGVVIAAPTHLHATYIETCVARGLPAFCEKPVDLSLERVDHCLERVQASGVPVLIGFHRRFDTARREVYEAAKSGALGRIEHILQISRDPRLPPESFIAHSGGIVRDMLIHDLDELVWHCGKGAVTVQADLHRLVEPELMQKYDDFDSAAITIVFEDGPQCQLAASRRSTYGFDQRIEVFGSNGMVSCPSAQVSSVVKHNADGVLGARLLDHFPQRYMAAYAAEMENFLAVINGTEQPLCTVADARASLVLAELVLESSRTGRKISATGL